MSSQSLPSSSRGTAKSRREKPHIELAPDQPLTTQGKPRARVYVACLQCRSRKIRCDGAKPVCHNCSRRVMPADPCVYDAAPKRRGPDRTPGARQRMAREARQESEADSLASRHRRRKKRDSSSPQPQPLIRSSSDPIPPIRPLSLVLDPQLVEMPPFQPAPTVSPSPLHPPSLTHSGSLLSDSLSVLPDPNLCHMTSSQGSHNTVHLTSYLHHHSQPSFLTTAPMMRTFLPPYNERDTDTDTDASEASLNIISEPSLDFARQTWWDSLLSLYCSFSPSISTIVSKRQHAANHITSDLRFLLRSSIYWFSFINVPHFLSIYFDSERRTRMQPSFLPAALAIATFFQSSEVGFGGEGRRKAMLLRDIAQGALEASLNARWIDEELAQAAWLLALFEVCAHPDHTSERCSSSLVMLDTIIRTLSLTFIDVEDPASTRFSLHSVPSVVPAPQSWPNLPLTVGADNSRSPNPWQGCSCASRTLGERWAATNEYTPLWRSSPGWDNSWSEAEIKKETCRRLCWSTLVLVAGHTSYVTSTKRMPSEFFVVEPANFALLFPGEAIHSPDGHSGKDTVWSLNYRTMLLWHSCLSMRCNPSVSDAEMSRFALNAWLEADALDKALNMHGCDLERTFLFQGREYLFNVRSLVTHELQRFVAPSSGDMHHFFHEKAKEWLTHQANVAQRIVESLAAVTGHPSHQLMHRPFYAFWFMNQISRALSIWECDNSLTLALDVCTALFKPVDYLSALWPCSEQRRRSQRIWEELATACMKAGRPLPLRSSEMVTWN